MISRYVSIWDMACPSLGQTLSQSGTRVVLVWHFLTFRDYIESTYVLQNDFNTPIEYDRRDLTFSISQYKNLVLQDCEISTSHRRLKVVFCRHRIRLAKFTEGRARYNRSPKPTVVNQAHEIESPKSTEGRARYNRSPKLLEKAK